VVECNAVVRGGWVGRLGGREKGKKEKGESKKGKKEKRKKEKGRKGKRRFHVVNYLILFWLPQIYNYYTYNQKVKNVHFVKKSTV
ncbi:MAG: hypothetical protein FWC10_05000, partial [Lentimicrobiaceae bacterium]|nr:hypothetical protein [Lentimicrobiaceae bacterium]